MDWGQLPYSVPEQGDAFRLQQENNELKEQVEQLQDYAERQISQRDEQIRRLSQRIEELESQKLQAEPKAPVYGRRDNPRTTEKGMLDGRSNADMAFDQKCQLLEEYRKEFGHLNVRPTDPEKYVPLLQFIVKQRKYYRAFQSGSLVSTVNQDRIRKLEEIGFEWSRRPDYENQFAKMLESLYAFKEKHGHCCVNAFPDADPELLRFVNRQRKFLRDAREIEREKLAPQSTAEDCSGSDDAESGDDDEQDPLVQADRDEEDGEERVRLRGKEKRREVPKHWTPSMRARIEAMDDLFMTLDQHEIAPITDKVAKHCRTKKFLKATKSYHPNTINWYQRFEEFRSFYKEHGHGLIPLQTLKSGGLKHFIRTERTLYDAIQNGLIESHPVFEKNIRFLKDNGFVYDEDAIKKEEERLMAIEVNKRRKELYDSTPHGQFELLQQSAEEVRKRLEAAQDTQNEAEAAVNEILQEYTAAQMKMREAEEKAAKDPVGSIVHVRPRGPGKPGGRAKVTRYFVAKVLQEEVKFYDVLYLEDNRKDNCIEGRFVEDAKTVSALLDLSKSDEPVETQTIVTRKRSKAVDSEADSSQCGRTAAKKPKVNQATGNGTAGSPGGKTKNSSSKTQPTKMPKRLAGKISTDALTLNAKLDGEATKPTIQKAATRSTPVAAKVSSPSNPVPQAAVRMNQQLYENPIENGQPRSGLDPKCTSIQHQTNKNLPRRQLTLTQSTVNKKHAVSAFPAKRVTKDVGKTKTEVQITPKHPIGSIVHVRSRGEQKPGGLGKVINFFASKVLSEFIPFYDVEYLNNKRKDTCIEGRFISDGKAKITT